MLCGQCVVTTVSQGEEAWLKHGENAFGSDDIDELIDILRDLQSHPDKVRAIGQAGRETAQEAFHINRFQKDWSGLVPELGL